MKRGLFIFLSLLMLCLLTVPFGALAEVKLEFINQKIEAVDTFKKIIEVFEAQNPDIDIELNSPSDSTTVLAARAASGDLPDLWTDWPMLTYYKEFVRGGYVLDITDQPFLENINESTLELCKMPDDGRIYTAPISLNTYGVYYSVKDFEELGLTPPKTYDEFIQLLDQVKASGKTPIIFSDKDAWTVEHFFAFNSGVWTPNFMDVYKACLNGESHISENADVRTTAQRVVDLRKNYGQPDTLGTAYSDAINDFANGKATMFIQGIWAAPSIRKANPDFEYSMFPVPADKEEDLRVMAGVDCAIDVCAVNDNQEAALKFVEFLLTPENAKLYSELDRSPSAVMGGSVDLGEINVLVELLNQGKIFPQLFNLTTSDIQANEPDLCQMLVGDGDVDSFLEQMDALWFDAAQ